MPRREDERLANLSRGHPVACTCQACTDKFLKKKGIKPGRPAKGRKLAAEAVKRHPKNCECPSCSILRSAGSLPGSGEGVKGFFKRLLTR